MKKFEEKDFTELKVEDLSKSIANYKNEILKTVSRDLIFIKVNRMIYLYGFTIILIALLILAFLIIFDVLPLAENVGKDFMVPLITGIFVELIALMVIVFKYLFDPIREMMQHTMSLISDEKTPSAEAQRPLLASSSKSDDLSSEGVM